MIQDVQASDFTAGSEHYFAADPMYRNGYSLILEGGLRGKKVLEVCCGEGNLSELIARVGGARVVAVDANHEAITVAQERHRSTADVQFVCGDVANLHFLEAEQFDVVVAQAAMHHLSHNLTGFAREIHRVLKPGGRAVFINEPMGHNAVVAAVRGIRNARHHWLDEANLFVEAVDLFAKPFSRYKLYHFGLFSYFCKGLPQGFALTKPIYSTVNALDQLLFRVLPASGKYAANFNACFWK